MAVDTNKIDEASEKMAEQTKATQADMALKYSQSALNLAHARDILARIGEPPAAGGKKRASASP